MTIATRQKHQLSPLPLDLILRGAKSDQVSEHRLVGIIIDNKFRWDSHADNVCKTVSTWVFLPFSFLRYIVDIDIRKLFFNACIKFHIDYTSVVWDKCSDVLTLKEIKFSAQKSCKVNLFRYDSNYTDQKLNAMRWRAYTNNWNATRVCSYTRSLTMRPHSIHLTRTDVLRHATPTLYKVLNDEAPQYTSNPYRRPSPRYSNSIQGP